MSDAPLSRRARRTSEEEAADLAAQNDPTLAFARGIATGEIAALNADGDALSRRDRRRLERLAMPLEAWTAEEEMIATGQIPAMTPERIAEQERISRQKAALAAAEAAAASQEFKALASAELPRVNRAAVTQAPAAETPFAPAPETPIAPAAAPSFVPEVAAAPRVPVEQIPSVPVAQVPAPGADAPLRGLAPYQPRVILDDDDDIAVQPGTAVATPPAPTSFEPAVAPIAPAPAPEGQALPSAADFEPAAPAAPFDAPVASTLGQQDDARSRVFDELFPPGSSQEALLRQDPFAPAEAPQVPASGPVPVEDHRALVEPLESPIPVLSPPMPETSPRNGADEIRRLAAEAISGIERASRVEEAPTAPASAPVAAVPAQPEPVYPPYAQPGASPGAQQSAFAAAPDLAPHHATFDQVAGTPTGGIAVQPFPGVVSSPTPPSGQFPQVNPTPPSGQFAQVNPTPPSGQFAQVNPTPPSGQFPQVNPTPPSGQFAQVNPTKPSPFPGGNPGGAWSVHPLEAAPTPRADVNDFSPVTPVASPDFSSLQQPAAPSPFPGVGVGSGEATATGQISPIRRLEPAPVGGVKHFQWLHLAVIGALMFVLGVVIYHVAFGQ